MDTNKMQIKTSQSISFSDAIALTSLAIVVLSFLWNVFFGYGKLVGRMDAMQNDITEMRNDLAGTKSLFTGEINSVKASIVNLENKMEKRFDRLEDKIEKLSDRLDRHIEQQP